MRSLTKLAVRALERATCTLACVLAVSSVGCAMAPDEGPEQSNRELVGRSEQALSLSSSPKNAVPLWARATFDPVLGRTMVDVATSEVPPIDVVPDHDPHTADQFLLVQVFRDRDGKREVLEVLGAKKIGPGGGCIHFSVPALVGDRLQIGGVVRLANSMPPTAGVATPIEVVVGDWLNDPTVLLGSH
ncbi:MAG: hypothetical protein HYV09_39665 [Deltaproteobacteria bacterium]|nr:hypothetical protein [Deltaproteobacteria bacterium]